MSDLIRLEHRAAPWSGASDARLDVEYRYYDVPTAGVLAQGNHQYLFWCATRADEDPNIWLYVAISDVDRATLEQGPPEEFDVRLQALLLGGWGVMAMATAKSGIVEFVEADLSLDGIEAAHNQLLSRLDELARHAHLNTRTLTAS